MMALSDRILLRLNASPATARRLARELEADVRVVHSTLRGLQAEGLVEHGAARDGGVPWRLVPSVRVEYRPAHLVVTGARPPRRLPSGPACGAVMSSGRPCRLLAAREGRCFVHAARMTG